MTQIAVRLEDVSKMFTLRRERLRTFQELFVSWRGYRHRRPETFWALSNLSLDVAEGETLGIIGPNGAGKSTLLKLVARIIVPNKGRVTVSGRVTSLLELGVGFHPDLTGRENVFLYGSLLGLRKGTVRQRFDQIVAFSEIESFIDLPVKTYSSGMRLRLAFSVVIHMDPDVLLIDEVLAVGDYAFQTKCLERINALQDRNVTVLFVSHRMDTVQRLCTRAIWLEHGQMCDDGPSHLVVGRYLDAVAHKADKQLKVRNLTAAERKTAGRREESSGEYQSRWGNGQIEILRVRVVDDAGRERYVFVTDEELTIQISYRVAKSVENPVFELALHRSDDLHIASPNTQFANYEIPIAQGTGIINYTIPQLPLLPGSYQLSVAAHNQTGTRMFDYHDRLYTIQVNPGGTSERLGLMHLGGRWWRANDR